MVQTALDILTASWERLLSLVPPLGLVLAGLLLALLLVGLLDRDRFRAGLGWAGARLTRLGRWALAALAVGAGATLLRVSRHAVDARLSTQQSARYANAADPDGGQTVQSAPRVSFLQDTTYTRQLTIPRDVFTRIQLNHGWEQLLPYLSSADIDTVQEWREAFTPQGQNLVYSREVTFQTEKSVNMDTSKVSADLRFVDPAGGRGTYYNAVFNADYTFTNPNTTSSVMRFAFPLPTGSGTLSNFKLTVDGKEFRASDLVDGSVWQGTVPAGGKVAVNVTYRNQGARSWRYELAARREAIKFFNLTVTADRPAKFQRYTLFPTAQARAALGGVNTLRWQLQDVITAQDISVIFTQGNLRETLAKVGLAGPLAALLLALLALAWAWTRRLTLRPLALAAAALGLALGLTLGGVLTGYLPVLLAELLGSAIAAALATLALGRAYLTPAVLCALVPLAFLTGGNAGLLLVLLAVVAGAVLLRPVWGRKDGLNV